MPRPTFKTDHNVADRRFTAVGLSHPTPDTTLLFHGQQQLTHRLPCPPMQAFSFNYQCETYKNLSVWGKRLLNYVCVLVTTSVRRGDFCRPGLSPLPSPIEAACRTHYDNDSGTERRTACTASGVSHLTEFSPLEKARFDHVAGCV